MRTGGRPGQAPAALEAKQAGTGEDELDRVIGVAMRFAVADADRAVAIRLNDKADDAFVFLHLAVAETLVKRKSIADIVGRAQIQPGRELREILCHEALLFAVANGRAGENAPGGTRHGQVAVRAIDLKAGHSASSMAIAASS